MFSLFLISWMPSHIILQTFYKASDIWWTFYIKQRQEDSKNACKPWVNLTSNDQILKLSAAVHQKIPSLDKVENQS